MAYSVSASIAVDNATPKVGQVVGFAVTVDNSGGTVAIKVRGLIPQPSDANFPCAIGSSDIPINRFSPAGCGATARSTAVAAGSSKIFYFAAALHCAGALPMNAIVDATRDDTGAQVQVVPGSAVTVTAS